jgi:hypothetical protein
MRLQITSLGALVVLSAVIASAQTATFQFPAKVEAGSAFSVPTSGSGDGALYIVGPADALRRKVHLGQEVSFSADELHNAGHYVAILAAGDSFQSAQFEVTASPHPAKLSFLAKPSRLPVQLSDGISGVAFVFDVFGNLVLQPEQVSFELSDATGRAQSRSATSRDGVAWVKMNSAAKAGPARIQASTANVRETRVIQQVAGDPCSIRMTVRPSSDKRIALETDPVRDCSGNPVPDGTIVTFTEQYGGRQSTIDVPLKHGVARTELPAEKGAVISVATGVVLGNEIHWNR